MKNINLSSLFILLSIGLITVSINCTKLISQNDVDPLMMEFVQSKDYQFNELLSCKSIAFDKSHISYVNEDKNKPVITLVFQKNGQIIGTVEAIKNSNENIKLPNNGRFFMIYRSFELFDLNENSGKIEIIDLNYDNYIVGNAELVLGRVTNSVYNPLPQELLGKYKNLIGENRTYLENKKGLVKNGGTSKSQVLCDGNNNGDVSFGECYKCFNAACQSQTTCYTMCYLIGDVAGWVVSPLNAPWCQTSIAAACVYISLEY